MKLSIEIRPGEGGEDAKLLVHEQARIYLAHFNRSGLPVTIVNDQPG